MPLNKSQSYTDTIKSGWWQKRACGVCGVAVECNIGRAEVRAAIRSGSLRCDGCQVSETE